MESLENEIRRKYIGMEAPLSKHRVEILSDLYGISQKEIHQMIKPIEVRTSWNISEERKRELYNKGLTDTEMVVELGCSRKLIENWRGKNKLKPNNPKKGGE